MASPDSFLARQKFSLPHWLLIAMAALFVLAFVPGGVKRAMEGVANQAKDWLPANYPESIDLAWFAQHFSSAQFVLVSWDECTLEDPNDRLRLLANKLSREVDDRGQRVFKEILTGPGMIERLTQAPSNLNTAAAVSRLEGALVGPQRLDDAGQPLPDVMRTTCLVAYMSEYTTQSNRRMRRAIEAIENVVTLECGVPLKSLRMAGPPVDNVTIDQQGERSLRRLALFAGLIGFGLAYWSFRSWKLTLAVFTVAAISAATSIAIVYWFGAVEVSVFGLATPRLGKMDAILNSMPAVVYVLGLSGAIHVVNYYRDERAERGAAGAVERGVRISWGPCLLAAVTTAVGLASLGSSDIVPVEKFGVMTAIGVLVTVAVLFTVLPVLLHLFADRNLPERASGSHGAALPGWATRLFDGVTRRHTLVSLGCVALMIAMAAGLPQITTSVELLKLLDDDVDLIHDYAWLEENLGNLVPVEVVVALGPEQQRGPDELAETPDSDRYRMTMVERMALSRRIQERIEGIDSVSRALSAASFGPKPAVGGSKSRRQAADYTTSKALEEPQNLERLAEYVRPEIVPEDHEGPPRQLWRVSARVAALAGVDYGQFLNRLRTEVEPVLAAYRARDELVQALHAKGLTLNEARIGVAYRTTEEDEQAADSAAVELYRLLRSSDLRGRAYALNVAKLVDAPAERLAKYNELDAIVSLDDGEVEAFFADTPLTNVVLLGGEGATDGGFASTYTGIVPLVYKTQGELLRSLRESIIWATVLIGVVMVVLLRSPGAGLVSMLPNVFPIVVVFGGLGWSGWKVDIGIMMTASVALGVAVDDTIHFLTWFRRGVAQGLDRRRATMLAYDRCATAMTQTTLVAGLGLMVFATSTFTPSQQFGYMMVTMLTAALLGDLFMLPALLCGPLGAFFAPRVTGPPAASNKAGELLVEGNDPADGDVLPFPEPPSAGTTEVDSVGSSEAVEEDHEHRSDPPAPADEPISPSNASLQAKLQQFRRG